MEITAQLVKQLREKTGAGMMDCKKALIETHGDIASAEEYLRKKGLMDAAKKSTRTAADGLVAIAISDDKKTAAIVELNSETDFVARNLRPERRGHVTGTVFELDSEYYKGDVFVALPGKFNVYNALCAMCTAYKEGISIDDVLNAMAGINVPGRMQPVENNFGVNILVDYAHNAAALESVLNTLKEYTEGRIITVFGCGGNRSKTRRFEMGEVSGNLSDHTIITSDNPRNEEPDAIIGDIITGISKTNGKYEIESDRSKAIKLAVSMAQEGDTVLIAGKGHEDYQIFSDRTIHFDDREQAETAVKEREGNN